MKKTGVADRRWKGGLGFAVGLAIVMGRATQAAAAEPFYLSSSTAGQEAGLSPQQATILRLSREASALFDAADYAGAEARLKELTPLISEMFGAESQGMAELQVNLGDALRAQARHAEAATAYASALEIRQSLTEQPPLDIEAVVYSLAGVQWGAGQFQEAAASYQSAVHIRRTVLGRRHTATADALLNFSRVELDRARYTTALPAAEEAWSIQAEVWGERSLQATEALSMRGAARQASGLWNDAEQDFRHVVELRQALAPDDEISMANTLNDLGRTLETLGRYSEAEPVQLRGLEILRRAWGPRHPKLWWALNSYTNTVYSRVMAGEPAEVMRRIAARGGVTATSETAEDQAIRARFAVVEDLYRDTLSIAREGHGPREAVTAASLANLANVLAAQGRLAESEALSREAISIYEETVGSSHPDVATTRINLGNTLNGLQRYEEALDQHRWAMSIQQTVYSSGHPHMGDLVNAIAVDLLMMDRLIEGVDYLDAAAVHRMRTVCPTGDQGPPTHHPWTYADPGCSGHPSFTASIAANAAVRLVFEDRPFASVRMISHAGNMVLGRTRLRYTVFEDARTEMNRFGYVHRQFVSGAWAAAESTAKPEVSGDLTRFYWPSRSQRSRSVETGVQ